MGSQLRGFTLIEMLITVVMIALIMSIAIPSYRQYVLRANRADATTALLHLASAQERFYLQNDSYADNAQMVLDPPDGLGFPAATSERGYYKLTIEDNGGLTVGFLAKAEVDAAAAQKDDDDCKTFTIDERGERTAKDGGGADNFDTCWR